MKNSSKPSERTPLVTHEDLKKQEQSDNGHSSENDEEFVVIDMAAEGSESNSTRNYFPGNSASVTSSQKTPSGYFGEGFQEALDALGIFPSLESLGNMMAAIKFSDFITEGYDYSSPENQMHYMEILAKTSAATVLPAAFLARLVKFHWPEKNNFYQPLIALLDFPEVAAFLIQTAMFLATEIKPKIYGESSNSPVYLSNQEAGGIIACCMFLALIRSGITEWSGLEDKTGKLKARYALGNPVAKKMSALLDKAIRIIKSKPIKTFLDTLYYSSLTHSFFISVEGVIGKVPSESQDIARYTMTGFMGIFMTSVINLLPANGKTIPVKKLAQAIYSMAAVISLLMDAVMEAEAPESETFWDEETARTVKIESGVFLQVFIMLTLLLGVYNGKLKSALNKMKEDVSVSCGALRKFFSLHPDKSGTIGDSPDSNDIESGDEDESEDEDAIRKVKIYDEDEEDSEEIDSDVESAIFDETLLEPASTQNFVKEISRDSISEGSSTCKDSGSVNTAAGGNTTLAPLPSMSSLLSYSIFREEPGNQVRSESSPEIEVLPGGSDPHFSGSSQTSFHIIH